MNTTRKPVLSGPAHHRTLRMIGTCAACKRPTARDVQVWDLYSLGWNQGTRYLMDATRPRGETSATLACPCGSRLVLRAVEGTVTESPCDDRCTSARGRKCECSCGGAHHGEDHL